MNFLKSETTNEPETLPEKKTSKYKKYIMSSSSSATTENKEVGHQQLDAIMEREHQNNKMDIWSKIDKTQKIQKLHAYAEKYGHEHNYTNDEIRVLKGFFIQSLEKGKLNKVKEVVYDKEKREIVAIPALTVDEIKDQPRHFTLKNLDAKRISTMKSLTAKRPPPLALNQTDV